MLAERQVRLGFAFPSKTDGGGADGLQPPLTLEPTRFYEQLGPHDVRLRDSVPAHSPALVLFPKQALNPPGPTSWSGEPDSPEGPSSAGTESPCKRDLGCRGISSPPWVEKETEARGRKVTCWRSQNSERRLFNHGLWGKPAHPYSAFKIRSFILKPEFLAPRGNRKVLVLMGSGEGWLLLERTGILPGHHGAVASCRLAPSTRRSVTVPARPRQAFGRVSPGPCSICSIGTRGVSCLPRRPAISQHAPPCATQGLAPNCHCRVKGPRLRNRAGGERSATAAKEPVAGRRRRLTGSAERAAGPRVPRGEGGRQGRL